MSERVNGSRLRERRWLRNLIQTDAENHDLEDRCDLLQLRRAESSDTSRFWTDGSSKRTVDCETP